MHLTSSHFYFDELAIQTGRSDALGCLPLVRLILLGDIFFGVAALTIHCHHPSCGEKLFGVAEVTVVSLLE